MSHYEIRFTKEAVKDFKKLSPKLQRKLRAILSETVSPSPYCGKRLVGELEGYWSYRLTYRDRIVYSMDDRTRIVIVHRTKTYYGE